MIIEFICNVLAAVLLGVIKLFPALPKIDTSFLDDVIRALSLIDTFISLRVLSGCFLVVFLFMNIQTIWSVIMWVVRKLPGVE